MDRLIDGHDLPADLTGGQRGVAQAVLDEFDNASCDLADRCASPRRWLDRWIGQPIGGYLAIHEDTYGAEHEYETFRSFWVVDLNDEETMAICEDCYGEDETTALIEKMRSEG